MEKIIYYNSLKKEMEGSQISKARKFVKLKLIENKGFDNYLVKHIEGYNKTDYSVNSNLEECNCQYYVRNNKPCSHILAVALFKIQEDTNGTSNSFFE
jgi:hypothetical protein|tara:strand:+ start:159 stop:452 length:294 start_codon:yes stop_codon:yes gene_type:complete